MTTSPEEEFPVPEGGWRVCPWTNVTSDKCPSFQETKHKDEKDLGQHVYWHMIEMVRAGVYEELPDGNLRLKEQYR